MIWGRVRNNTKLDSECCNHLGRFGHIARSVIFWVTSTDGPESLPPDDVNTLWVPYTFVFIIFVLVWTMVSQKVTVRHVSCVSLSDSPDPIWWWCQVLSCTRFYLVSFFTSQKANKFATWANIKVWPNLNDCNWMLWRSMKDTPKNSAEREFSDGNTASRSVWTEMDH